ncbi:IclR family transcriptional regulator [Sporolactobacillus laevolacticus]|uniref:IclR family transcriptional regulator n=1 Tax=Sporolactobacillus laevolacticus DSM 442 TaxID=1395513 RepID=V6IWH2_9BACL|nr:IclR family transcriptional regulator [Sporolactobacillus laevolacticus]EST11607.1 hypothetical protein P343_11300 [Sporolactobacillus laevolacticus DSM 442]
MKGTQSLERALDILFALGDDGETQTIAEIAQRISIPESSVYRLIQTLERNGLVERKGQGQIGLGLRILELAKSLNSQFRNRLKSSAAPLMEQLSEETKETVVLFVRTGTNVICVKSVAGQHLVRFVVEDGKTFPIQNGASGKAILAFETSKIINQVIHTIETDLVDDFLEELQVIREKGFSETSSEVDPGIIGIAAPIFDQANHVIASVTVAGPGDRIKDEKLSAIVPHVIKTAKRISSSLSFSTTLS